MASRHNTLPEDACCNGHCTCCPYGCTFIAPVILGFLALAFTWSGTFGCNYLEISDPTIFSRSSFTMGPWYVQKFSTVPETFEDVLDEMQQENDDEDDDRFDDDDGDCTTWYNHDDLETQEWLDTPLRFARFVTLLAALLSLLFWIPLQFGGCMLLTPCVRITLMIMFSVVSICMLLSLVIMASDICQGAPNCHLDGTGSTAVVAFVLWMLTAVSMAFLKERGEKISSAAVATPSHEPEQHQQPEPETRATTTVVVRTVTEQDGTVVKLTTKTHTDANGLKTVTETREVLRRPASSSTSRPPVASPIPPAFPPTANTTDMVIVEEDIPIAEARIIPDDGK